MARCLLLLLFVPFTLLNRSYSQKLERQNLAEILDLFTGLEPLLRFFRNHSDPLAKSILHTFGTECFFTVEPKVPSPDDKARKPFVVIEGNNRPSRDVVGVSLARILDGRYFNNPAPCLIRYLELLPSNSLLRRAFFALSLYATDFNVRVQLASGRSVVTNGCWLDQLVFAVEKTYSDLPDVKSDMFQWPSDLLQPDLTFFLSSTLRYRSQMFVTRLGNEHQNRSLELYRRLQHRYPIMILDRNVKPDIIYKHMVRILSRRRDLRSRVDIDESAEVRLQMFSGLEGILNFFRNNSNTLAQSILKTFEKDCMFNLTRAVPEGATRKPFVVIEGNCHNSRDTIGKSVARKMNARYMVHPASCLVKYIDVMPKASLLRRAFYVLSLYAVSHSVKAHLSTNKAVVLNGYWHDQLTYSMAQALKPGNNIDLTADQFLMPEVLLPPDLIVYLLADDHRLVDNRAAPNVLTSTLEMYKSLQSTYPIIIEEMAKDDRDTTANVFKHIQDRLSHTRHIVQQEYEEVSDMLHLFSGLQPLLEFFRTSPHPFAKEILSTFYKQWTSFHELDTLPRKPFIVVEGNNRTSRDVISIRLSQLMSGMYLKHPAACLRDFMYTLPSGSLLRRAFYLLSLYATSLDVRLQTRVKPAIVNGFWLDQLTFALIQSFQYGRLPRVRTPIYQWPQELAMPDLIIYLNHPDHLNKRSPIVRSHNNWKPRSLELYRKLQALYNIKIVEVDADFWQTTDEIYKYLLQNDIFQQNTTQATTSQS